MTEKGPWFPTVWSGSGSVFGGDTGAWKALSPGPRTHRNSSENECVLPGHVVPQERVFLSGSGGSRQNKLTARAAWALLHQPGHKTGCELLSLWTYLSYINYVVFVTEREANFSRRDCTRFMRHVGEFALFASLMCPCFTKEYCSWYCRARVL